MKLPIKIEHNNKVYWIKEATKTSGIYMNGVEPKIEIIIKENEYTTIAK